ncbi:MAG TPA: hypothetical protein ENK70_05675 [Methylophaga sp.]|nr:hypothetical protein [Methylophaga sp.]
MNIKDIKVTILVVIGIIIIIAAAIYALASNEEVSIDIISSTINTAVATNESLDLPSVEELTEEEKSDAQVRDQERIAEVGDIESALKDFVEAKGYYPTTIDEIVPDYISKLPTDPMPESYEYTYTCIGSTNPCVLYDLSYILEVGTDELPAGLNLVSPEEIAIP